MSIREELEKVVGEAVRDITAVGFCPAPKSSVRKIVWRVVAASLRASNLAGPEKKKPKMKMMWYCAKCDYDRHPLFSLNENGGYCPDCGKKLIQRESIDRWEYGDEEFNFALDSHASEVNKEADELSKYGSES
jgi:ribosomal protein L37AE/L43A